MLSFYKPKFGHFMSYKKNKRIILLLFTLLLFHMQIFFSSENHTLSHIHTSPPIDIVYLWVDGSDPNWLSIKNQYLQPDHQYSTIDEEACSDNRFFDHEELKYSLRSLVKFAPFFNHIYIVKMNQRPKWLINHPQITIIDHQEIFKNSEDLPSFNSQSIESNIHRIPGLSEHFIYFNDDVLLGHKVAPSDFFTESGKIKVLFEPGLTVSKSPEVQASLYRKAWLNSSALLNTYFFEERRQRLCHAPFALRKSFIEQVECLFPFVFTSNSSHQFRNDQDFNLTNGLLQYIWKYQDKIERGSLTNKMISIYNDELFLLTEIQLVDLIKTSPHTFCIQDCITKKGIKTCNLLKKIFNDLFPNPAPWENTSDASLEIGLQNEQ